MSDMVDMYVEGRQIRKALRTVFGRDCPTCATQRPKAQPSILLPQQRCRLDGYVDPRPHTTVEQRNEAYKTAGLNWVEDIQP